MTKLGSTISRSAVASFIVFGVVSAAALAEDLSKYRHFQFGTDLRTVAKQTGSNPSQAKLIHSRPALIQDLEWRPQPASSSGAESAQEVLFTFYNGTLFRIAINYDRYQTEGLTTGDLVQAISATYGLPAKLSVPVKTAEDSFGDQEETLARWEDPQYRFELLRASYGPGYRLIGVLKRLEGPLQAATLEAKRLDDLEAPQRDAARIASEQSAIKTTLEKARLVNKPKFRP